MSWRLLFFTLLILAGVATVGGLYTGDWLIEHAPRQANVPDFQETEPAPMVDANGVPLLRQPPQPLMNGKLGVPEQIVSVDWKVKAENLSQEKTTSSTPISASAPANVISTVSDANSSSRIIKTRPIAAPTGIITNTASGSWEPAFRREIAACRQLGFLERAACVGEVRERYCGANKAWGKVNDCPQR